MEVHDPISKEKVDEREIGEAKIQEQVREEHVKIYLAGKNQRCKKLVERIKRGKNYQAVLFTKAVEKMIRRKDELGG